VPLAEHATPGRRWCDEDVGEAATDARPGQRRWQALSPRDWAHSVGEIAGLLRAEREEGTRQITGNPGEPITEALAETDRCARVRDAYSAYGPRLGGAGAGATGGVRTYTPVDTADEEAA
jgi:acyl-CoA reductase-like NAD-dependent aldehyde dehydrogenase